MTSKTDVDLEEWGIPLSAKPEQRVLWTRMIDVWLKFAGTIPEPSLDLGAARQQGRTVSVDPFPRGFVDVRAIGENLPFKEGYFNSVVLESVLKHVLSPEQTLAEVRRTMRLGGSLYVTSPVNHIDSHRHSFTSTQLCRLVETAGFRIFKRMGLGLSSNRLDGILRRRVSRLYTTIRPPVRFSRTLYLVAKAV
jgi:SAM-dependent methyltransferase